LLSFLVSADSSRLRRSATQIEKGFYDESGSDDEHPGKLIEKQIVEAAERCGLDPFEMAAVEKEV